MSEELRSCATCKLLHKNCEGDCDKCEHAVEDTPGNLTCKCLRCDNYNNFKYYEEDEERTRFFK